MRGDGNRSVDVHISQDRFAVDDVTRSFCSQNHQRITAVRLFSDLVNGWV